MRSILMVPLLPKCVYRKTISTMCLAHLPEKLQQLVVIVLTMALQLLHINFRNKLA